MSAVIDFFEDHSDIAFVRLLHVDYGNIVRTRIVSKFRFLAMSASREDPDQIATLSPLCVFWTQDLKGSRWEVVNTNDDDHWHPDWPTLRVFPAEAETAVVMCFIKENAQKEGPFGRCPRSALHRVLSKAEKAGIKFLSGHEIEFTIMPAKDAVAGIDNIEGNWTTAGLRHPAAKVLNDAVKCLEEAGIKVWNFCSEGGQGQFEIATGPADPMMAADAVVFASETIKTVAAKAGYHATLHPYPFEGADSVGLHTHLSMSDTTGADSFLAALMEHGAALTAFLLGGKDSYQPSRSAMIGAGDICWSTYKFGPVHQLRPGRYEIRWPDSLTNPHLQLAAILGVGLSGIERQTKLSMKGSSGNGIGAPLSEEQKKDLGVRERVPEDLAGRVAALKADQEVFSRAMGSLCVQSYVDYRTACVSMGEPDDAKRRALEILHI